jgi:Flp pilus assembly protein TadG
MKKTIVQLVQKALDDQRGQILPWIAVVLVGLLGTAGLSIDVGRAYVAHSQLQNYANAAALAAAGEVYSTSSTNNATTVATSYSAASGDENVNGSLGAVTTTITTVCLNVLMPTGSSCSTSSVANAVKVKQTASVPTYFMKLFGFNSLSISSQATASMQGAAEPWNVAIVLDATASMGSAPASGGSCDGYSTLFTCALGGAKALLQAVQPCPGGANCTSSNTQFRVALFSFPNVTTASVADDYTCSGTPTHEPYTLPLSTGYSSESTTLSGYTPLGYATASTSTSHGVTTTTYTSTQPVATYEDTPIGTTSDGDANGFSSNYWSATASGNLSTSSSLAKAVGGCMKNPGGESTYYGGVLYAAQAALAAEQAKYGGKNALIILSDGQANATNDKFPGSSNVPASGQTSQAAYGFSVATNSTSSTFNNLNTTGTTTKTFGYYPDFHDECQQAIMAAQAAQAAGTTVFSVAFGSEDDGCGVAGSGATVTDTSLIASATTGNPALSLASLTPCITMKNIASPATSTTSYFYADTSSATNGCTDNAHTVSQINQIFLSISSYFTTPRLIPNNAT